MSRRISKSTLQKQLMSMMLGIAILASVPVALAVTRFKLNGVDYDPVSQTISFKSTGPVNATVNSVNIGKNKRIILDIEDTEIGSIPRDILLFQQLSQKWPAIKGITVNQFGGAHPVVRVLLDVDGINYSTQLLQNRTQHLGLKVSAVQPSNVNPQTLGQSAPSNTSNQVTSNNIQELKKAISVLNQRYEQLDKDNQQLRVQLQQESQKSTISLKQQPVDVQQIKDRNMALQSQVNKLQQDNSSLQKRVAQTHPTASAATTAAASVSTPNTEVTRLKSELASAIEKNSTLQSQNAQLNNQLQQRPAAGHPAVATTPLQKQVTTLQQENAKLKEQLKAGTTKPVAAGTSAVIDDPQLSGIKQQLEQAKSALNRSITTINDQNKEISYLKRQVEQMQGVADANARDQLTVLNTKIEQKDSEIKSLNDKLKTQPTPVNNDAELASLKADVQAKTTAIEELKAKVASAESQLKAAETKTKSTATNTKKPTAPTSNAASAKEIAELKRSLDTAKQDNLQLQQAISTLSSQREEIQRNEKMLTEKVLELQKATTQKTEETPSAASTPAKTVAQSAQVKSLTAEIATLKQDKAKLKTVNESLFSELNTLKAKPQSKSPVNQQVAALNTKVGNLESQLNDLMQDKKSLSEEVETLKADVDKREKALAEATAAASAAKTAVPATPAKEKEVAKTASDSKPAAKEASQVAALNNEMMKRQLSESQAKLTESEARYRKILLEYDRNQQKLKALTAANPKAGAAQGTFDASKQEQMTADNKRLQSQVDDLTKQLQVTRNKALELQKQVIKPESVSLDTPADTKSISNPTAEAEKLYTQAHTLDENKQSAQALDAYKKAAALDSKNPMYTNAVAISLANQEHYPEAIRTLQDYIDNHPYNSDVFNTLGKIYLMNGQPDEAKAAFAKAVPLNALSNYGSALKKQGKFQDAERVFKFALEMVPNDSELLFNLGNIYNAQNNLQLAKDNYSQAISVNPSFAEAHYNLGLVFSKLGDKSAAAEHLEKFLELNPNASNAEVIKTYVKKLKG